MHAEYDYSQMVSRFPAVIIREYAEFFFIPLVAQLVNDDSASNKIIIKEIIQVSRLSYWNHNCYNTFRKTLFRLVEVQQNSRMVTMTISWLKSTNVALRRAAAQV